MICNEIEGIGKCNQKFKSNNWQRNKTKDEGGGEYRILENGKIFEKVGVNFSEVYGKFSQNLKIKYQVLKMIQIFGHQVYQL